MEGVATVVKNAGSHYLLSALPGWELFPAVLRGKVRLGRSSSTNPVAVGDRVRYELDGEASEEHPAVITEILPRDNYIIRRSTNLSRQSHVIAANLDQAVIVVSLLFPEIKLPFLDRILVTCEVYKVPVLIALNKVDLYRHEVHWSELQTARTPFSPELQGIYPVDLGSLAEASLFDDAVQRERRFQLVDNINLFYVALTRAEKSLHVIAKLPSKKCREAVAKGRQEYGNFSELLYCYLGGNEEFSAGAPYDFAQMDREVGDRKELDFKGEYPSFPLNGRLTPSQEADDFFGDEGLAGIDASPRLRGIVLHDILSEVKTPADLENAVAAAVRDGRLDAAGGQKALALLQARLAAHPDWFPETLDGVEICNEVDLFDADGSEHRPDRVILRGRQAVIVDYKFGQEKAAYCQQLRRYAKLWHELGYDVVGAYVWYVEDDKKVTVI